MARILREGKCLLVAGANGCKRCKVDLLVAGLQGELLQACCQLLGSLCNLLLMVCLLQGGEQSCQACCKA